MLLRAYSFVIQCSRAVNTRCPVTKLNRKEIVSNYLKHYPVIRKPVHKTRLYLTLTGFSISVIGVKAWTFSEVKCQSEYPTITKHQKNGVNWKKILHIIYLDVWHWLGAVVAALSVAYINIQLPISLGELANMISTFASDAASNAAVKLCLPIGKIITLYLAQALGTLVYISLLSSAGENLAARLKSELYESFLHQGMSFFDQRRTGELVDCLFSDVQEFKSSFKQCVSQGLKNSIQICGCFFSLFNISPSMTYAVLLVVPAIISAGSVFGILLRRISHAAQEQSVKTFTMSEEVLSNIRTVRSFSNEDVECRNFNDELQLAKDLNIRLGYGIAFFQAGTNLFLNGLVLGTLYLGSQFMVSEHLTPGHLMSFLVTAQMIQKSFTQLSLTFGHFLKGKEAFQRITYFCELQTKLPCSGGIRIPHHSLIPTVEFKNVTFAYPTREKQTILKDFNLVLPAGKMVAVVGASGNGKSTIALLLERFYDVSRGAITLSNVDIRNLDPNWLRGTAVGMISQEPILFATSIKENIRYGKPDATDDEIYEAAKQANADGFIRTFPDGYDTLVGERGVAISGGQKQRIAIARALIRQPSVLILDEATSALDPESEKIVQETLEKVCIGKTVLVIAHRLSTVKNADVIAVLNKGVILEIGTHEQLIKKRGIYYGLMNQQKFDPSNTRTSG